jgi:hypothetical protein
MQTPCVLGHTRVIAQHQTTAGHLEHLPAWLFRSWLLPGQAQGSRITIDYSEHRQFRIAMTATKQHAFTFRYLSAILPCVFGLFHVVCAQHVCMRLIQIQQYCCHEPERANLSVTHSANLTFDSFYLLKRHFSTNAGPWRLLYPNPQQRWGAVFTRDFLKFCSSCSNATLGMSRIPCAEMAHK